MDRAELIRAVAIRMQLPEAQVADILDTWLAAIMQSVAQGETVFIPHLGAFSLRKNRKKTNQKANEAPRKQRIRIVFTPASRQAREPLVTHWLVSQQTMLLKRPGDSLQNFYVQQSPETVSEKMLTLLSGTTAGETEPPEVPYHTVRVFYATDRQQCADSQFQYNYEKIRAPEGVLNYGQCVVSIPDCHRLGRLESPFKIIGFKVKSDPNKHVMLHEVIPEAEQAFFNQLSSLIQATPHKDAFVFVHGFTVSFEDAARITGQIAYDLRLDCAPIFYSWPTQGGVAKYFADSGTIEWSTDHLKNFLMAIGQRSGAEKIYVIAHSMGNRAVCNAVSRLSEMASPLGQCALEQLILTAPDVDAGLFRQIAATLRKISQRVTLYASANDKALQVSRKANDFERAGGKPLVILPQVLDTVDASNVDTDFFGHSYATTNRTVMRDVYDLIHDNLPPAQRHELMAMHNAEGEYFTFCP